MWRILQDIVDHTGGLGIVDVVKVTGDDDSTIVESMDSQKLLVIKGELDEVVDDFKGSFGMTDIMTNLHPMLNFNQHKSDQAVWSIERGERTDPENPHRKVNNPEKIIVADQDNIATRYRLMNPDLVQNQGELKLKEWDVSFQPSRDKIQEFNDRVALAPQETFFMATVEGGDLKFYFGDPESSSHGTAMVFESDVEGDLPAGMFWHIGHVKTVLKYGLESDITIKFSQKGAMLIEVKSEYARWKYIMPCKKL